MAQGAFYVAYTESLIVAVCGYMLLNGIMRGNEDYSGLQRWGVEVQFGLFCVTFVLQILLSTIAKDEVPEEKEEKEDMKIPFSKNLHAYIANSYCSACFLIFLVFLLMFSKSMAVEKEPMLNIAMTSRGGDWYFHPANVTRSECNTGEWRETIFQYSNGIACLDNHTRQLVKGIHEFNQSIPNATWYYQSGWSNTVQIVSGKSHAAGRDENTVTAPPIGGSIAFGCIWAFVSLSLLLSCYTAYASTPPGEYCPLFLSPQALTGCNLAVVIGIPNLHAVYAECVDPSRGVLELIVLLLCVFFGDDVLKFLLSRVTTYPNAHLMSTLWSVVFIATPVFIAYSRQVHDMVYTFSLVISAIAAVSVLSQYIEVIASYSASAVTILVELYNKIYPPVIPAASQEVDKLPEDQGINKGQMEFRWSIPKLVKNERKMV
jgi:hypothetical protein